MADSVHNPPTSALVVVAACLAGTTYLLSALLEYPSAWFGRIVTLAAVVGLLVVQVLLSGLLYRNVQRNSDGYSLFFRRAALVVLATFVTLTATLLVPREVSLVSHDLHNEAGNQPVVSVVPA